MSVQQKIIEGIQVSLGVAIGCALATNAVKLARAYYLKRVGKHEENPNDETIFDEESL